MPGAERQLALDLAAAPTYRAEDFLSAPSNDSARLALAHPESWPNRRLALFGAAGCGKTHLAHLWCGAAGLFLMGETLPALPDPGAHARIVIDNADRHADAPTLLHWLNTCAESARAVLLIAETAPARWHVKLPDLDSRLRATQAIEIAPPEDSLLRALLARLLADRQLAVTETVQDWLLLHLPRTPAALREAVDRLDRAALARQGAVTIGLAKSCLKDVTDGSDI